MSKILVVEDNAESRYLLERLLSSRGHQVISAEDGEEGLRRARQDIPDIIISDIMMPVMNGFRFCREVKSDDALRQIPFIFYTATFVDKADEKLAMGLGASRFVIKPMEGDEFIGILDEVLDEHRRGVLPVPGGPLEGEETLLEMYDNSVARKLAETVDKLQNERKALIRSEQRLKEAQELAHIGHWELNLKSSVLEWSDEIYRILGLKPREFDASRDAFLVAVHPDDRDAVIAAYRNAVEKKTQYDIEYRLLLNDGTVKYVNEKLQTIYDDNGIPVFFMGTVQDITGSKEAEERVNHLNRVLRAIRDVNQLIIKEKDRGQLIRRTCDILIENRSYHNAWIALLDKGGKFMTAVDAGLDRDFSPMEELLREGKWTACAKRALDSRDLVIREEPKTQCVDCPLSGHYGGRGACSISLNHGGKNYGLLSVSVPGFAVGDEEEHGLLREVAGDIAFALYSIEVEEERRGMVEALRESESKFRSLVEQAAEMLFLHDTSGRIIDVNRETIRNTGYTREELLGMTVFDIDPDAGDRRDVEIYWEALKPEDPTATFEVRHRRKDGSIYPAEVILSKIVLAKGHCMLGLARDITERKEAEERIERSLREKETLLAEIHHRVKNNMQVMMSLLSLQSENTDDAGIQALLRECESRIRSMALIHERLYLSQDLSRVDVRDYMERLLERLFQSHGADSRVIGFSTRIEDVSFSIETAVPCGLIANELITNVLRHAFPGGRAGTVTVELGPDPAAEGYVLVVGDDGIGMPEEIDHRNPDSFGLQLVNILTQQLDGTVELDRSAGTLFRVTFRELQYKQRI
ncbi:MAG: PAS domain S-box protein [Deltaproteobacteria bacterium]|nr:PAS domain S-box protein [Deltaproteobacteria bacterium]